MNRLIDEKFKDSSPVETVERIRKILQKNGLSVTETWYEHSVANCYSLRLTIDETSFGCNGKGVTRDLCRASAYAELMERIQTGYIGAFARLNYPDAVMMDKAALKENSDILFPSLVKIVKDFDQLDVSEDAILDAAFDFEGSDTIVSIPFYNCTDDTTVYIPHSLMLPLYSSTGLAAGNSPEEAMVQGMSEIVERWCQRYFLNKDVVPPTIPDEYLQNYPLAWETITQIRSSGYEVMVKDCSMGWGWPVIATVFIDKRTHAYHVHMGASPVFEIALGRSLTETFQGRLLNSVADTRITESPKDPVTYRKSYVEGRGAYHLSYFADEPSYPFVPFEDRSHCSNKELLAYALNYFRQKDMKVYVRDMSYWGFCTYQIIVPNICSYHLNFLASHMNIPLLTSSTRKTRYQIQHATPDQLFEHQLMNSYNINYSFLDRIPRCSAILYLPVSPDPRIDHAVGYNFVGYVDWACGNMASAIQCAQNIERLNAPGISDYFSCYCRVMSMEKEGKSRQDILRQLAVFYHKDTIDQVARILEAEENPFTPYLVNCREDDSGCPNCPYNATCRRENNKKIGRIINQRAREYDHEKAFAELRALLKSLY